MATSGSRNWIATRDNIIYAALRKLGVKQSENPPRVEEIQDASFALNSMVFAWQNDGVHLWTKAEEIMPLTASTLSASLASSVLEVQTPFFRRDDSDSPLGLLTRDEYLAIPDKKTTADPISIYVDYQLANPMVYIWPRPIYTTTIVTGTDALYYLCIKDHTSAAANHPITGADYATYWQATTATPNTTWGTGVAYHSDVIRYSKVLRLQDFDVAADNPDFPVRWTQALIYGLASHLAPEYQISTTERGDLAARFSAEYGAARRLNFDNTDLRMMPSRR
jgi:hypothetical protein